MMPKEQSKQELRRAFTSLCLAGVIALTILGIFILSWLGPGMLIGYLIWGN